mgnify:CR=1 FL=1
MALVAGDQFPFRKGADGFHSCGALVSGGVGWARLRMETHWPSDIVAGFFIGGIWLGGVIWAIKAGDQRHTDNSIIG